MDFPDYDEDRDDGPPPGKVEVVFPGFTATGLDAERIERMVAEGVAERLLRERDGAIRKAVAKAVDERVTAHASALITAEVDRVLAEGWTEHDQWGDRTGKTLTLRQRIESLLTKKHGDSYGPKHTVVEKAMNEAIAAALAKDFREELEKARVAFRAQVDAVVQSKLAETLRSALGLRA